MSATPKRPQRVPARKAARLAAVLALYQQGQTGSDAKTVAVEFLAHRIKEEIEGLDISGLDRPLFERILKGVTLEAEGLDARVAPLLPADWPLSRLERTLLATLRAAAFELVHLLDVPARVVIVEYVDVADALCGERAPALVNAVLDRLARILRPSEFGLETPGTAAEGAS